MDIFAIEQPAYKETAATLKDLELLEGIWGLKKEWQDSYSSWKDGQFKALDVAAMEAAAQQCSKRVTKLGRDIKTCARARASHFQCSRTVCECGVSRLRF